MKINENGIMRDMTAAEVAAYEAYLAAAPRETPSESDTRLDEIEAALMELAAIVGGGRQWLKFMRDGLQTAK